MKVGPNCFSNNALPYNDFSATSASETVRRDIETDIGIEMSAVHELTCTYTPEAIFANSNGSILSYENASSVHWLFTLETKMATADSMMDLMPTSKSVLLGVRVGRMRN